MWFSGGEVVPVEPTEIMPTTLPNILQTLYDLLKTVGDVVGDIAESTVQFISDIPDVLADISLLFEVLPPTIKIFGMATMGFLIFRFALAYSKGYGQ